ncbi:MAG: hypothetical protein HUU20_24085, partial [Pirellulales bacterium]|nr:hypothetical protein [Pirellulales bacterium]
ITTVLTVDFLRRYLNPAADGKRRRVRLIAVAIGLLTVAISFLLPWGGGNFFEMATRALDPFTGPLAGMFALAFFDRRSSGRSAGIAFVAGLAVGFFLAFGHHPLGIPPFSFYLIAPGAILATVATGLAVSRLVGDRVE